MAVDQRTRLGVLFKRLRIITGNQVSYEYVDMGENASDLKAVRDGILGRETSEFYHALVRRGKPGDYHYYPVPLIFASPEERELAARETNRRPPQERWVRRRRNEILALLDLPEQP